MSTLELDFFLHFIRKGERQKHVAAIYFHIILMLNCLVPNKGELVFYKIDSISNDFFNCFQKFVTT